MTEQMNPTPGCFDWTELMTRDVEGAKTFYTGLLGWNLEPWPMPEGGTYWVLKAGDRPVGGIMNLPEQAPAEAPPHWMSYITVADVDASAAKAQELGGAVLHGPMDIPKVGRMAVIQDPQGATIALITYVPCDEAS